MGWSRRVTGRVGFPTEGLRRASSCGRSIFQEHENVVALEKDLMSGHRLDGRHAQRFAGTYVEPRAMARALDLASGQIPFGERSAVMSADVVDRIKDTLHVEECDGASVDFDELL